MNATTFLGQAMGFFLFIGGLSCLVNGSHVTKSVKAVLDNDGLYFIFGLILLALGVSLVIVHNRWDWHDACAIIISIMCWIIFIKGILNVLFPQIGKAITRPFVDSMNALYVGGLVDMIIGAFIFYHGFFQH